MNLSLRSSHPVWWGNGSLCGPVVAWMLCAMCVAKPLARSTGWLCHPWVLEPRKSLRGAVCQCMWVAENSTVWPLVSAPHELLSLPVSHLSWVVRRWVLVTH